MAITKEIIEDKIEIVGDYKSIQVRTATVIKEDGVEISRSFHRKVLDCISSSYDKDTDTWTHIDIWRVCRSSRNSFNSLDRRCKKC